MNKGFTLVELLIVMVLVGILVAFALPKYQASLERGRAVEGFTWLRQASDYINARYIMDNNQYQAAYNLPINDWVKERYFEFGSSYTEGRMEVTMDDGTTTLKLKLNRPGWYMLKGINQVGEFKEIQCTVCAEGESVCPDWEESCMKIGMKKVNNIYRMSVGAE